MRLARTRDTGLLLIAGFRLLKAVLLIAAGLGAFRLLDPATAARLQRWLFQFSLHGNELVQRALGLLSRRDPGKIAAIGLGAILYGLLFAVEGIGLWLGKRWAEYLTVIATSSLIPFELYELVKEITPVRLAALLANGAAVVYLIYRLRHPRRALPDHLTARRVDAAPPSG